MKFTTRARYALRAMIDLATHYDQHPVPRQDIARRQDISPHYLEQLFLKLRDAGLIQAVRGPGGGYILSASAEDLTVGTIIRGVDEVLAPVPCLRTESPLRCDRAPTCGTRPLWRELEKRTCEFLDSITLQDLCDDACELAGSD